MASAPKWYVVWVGKKAGIYRTWDECKAQVHGVTNAKYKSFASETEAEQAFQQGSFPKKLPEETQTSPTTSLLPTATPYITDSISVDASALGNPGIVEYRGVDTRTGDVLFQSAKIPRGTNNLGEFLAIVHGLAYLQKVGRDCVLYSDSRTAIGWVKKRHAPTTLPRDAHTEPMWTLVDRALRWLTTESFTTKIIHWDTPAWGQIKADFGRK